MQRSAVKLNASFATPHLQIDFHTVTHVQTYKHTLEHRKTCNSVIDILPVSYNICPLLGALLSRFVSFPVLSSSLDRRICVPHPVSPIFTRTQASHPRLDGKNAIMNNQTLISHFQALSLWHPRSYFWAILLHADVSSSSAHSESKNLCY